MNFSKFSQQIRVCRADFKSTIVGATIGRQSKTLQNPLADAICPYDLALIVIVGHDNGNAMRCGDISAMQM